MDYELTRLGRSLLEPVSELNTWARKNRAAIVAVRERFDGDATYAAGEGASVASRQAFSPDEKRPLSTVKQAPHLHLQCPQVAQRGHRADMATQGEN